MSQLFETCCHLSVALQKQSCHKEALDELTKATEVSSIPKVNLQWNFMVCMLHNNTLFCGEKNIIDLVKCCIFDQGVYQNSIIFFFNIHCPVLVLSFFITLDLF